MNADLKHLKKRKKSSTFFKKMNLLLLFFFSQVFPYLTSSNFQIRKLIYPKDTLLIHLFIYRRQKDRRTERRKDRKTERWKDGMVERRKDRKTERQKDRKTERQKDSSKNDKLSKPRDLHDCRYKFWYFLK